MSLIQKNIQKTTKGLENIELLLDNAIENEVKNFQINEVLEFFALPFNDLIFEASQLHRQFHNPNEVQISTLLSIKTGGCPEN
jgi:biotin synthase-like enzyme